MELGGDQQLRNASRRPDVLLLLKGGPTCPTVLRIGNSFERGPLPTLATPFNREILETPCLSKVKMPSIELFNGTADLDDHLDVYKAQMYVQDVDDATCC